MDYWSITGAEGSGGPEAEALVILHVTAAEDSQAAAAFHPNSLQLIKQQKSSTLRE